MKVVGLPDDDGKLLYRVYDTDKLPFKVVNAFLVFQENRGRSPNTVRSQAYDIVSFFKFLKQKDTSWVSVGLDEWVNFVHYLKYSTRHSGSYVLPTPNLSARSAATINRRLSTLNSFYKYHSARRDSILMPNIHECITNPFTNNHTALLSFAGKSKPRALKRALTVGKQKIPNNPPKTIAISDQKKALQSCNNRRDRLLILLLIETGMRIGQALGLKHEDIQSWKKQIAVTYRENNPNQVFSKSRQTLYVHISSQWLDLYTDYLITDMNDIDCNYVFCNLYNLNKRDKKTPMTYESVNALFRRLSKKVGVKISPHMLRHSHATELLKAGVSIEIVAKRLGHKSIETTKQIYEHLTAEDLKNELNRHRDESALLQYIYGDTEDVN
ncbi:MAG: site-specific integrase [Agarilytica sp.]